MRSLPSRGAWIEIRVRCFAPSSRPGSLPSRGAWIEIIWGSEPSGKKVVAPLAGSVD